MKRHFEPTDLTVRPFFRMLGAALLGFMAFLFFLQGRAAFFAESVQPAQCGTARDRLLCEAGNWILSITPAHLQGPLAGTAHVAFSLILVIGLIWIIKPIFVKGRIQ